MKHLNISKDLQETVYFAVLVLNAAVFPFSEALISIAAGLLLFQVFLFRSWRHPSVRSRSVKVLLFPVSVFFVYLFGTLFTNDFSLAVYELKKTVFWLVIPLAVFLSPRITSNKMIVILTVFTAAVFVSSLIITGKLIFNNSVQLSEFRNFSIVSHIRYSIQVGFAIIFLIWMVIRTNDITKNINRGWIIALAGWLLFFLILLKSLVGILAFSGTAVIGLLYYAGSVHNPKIKVPVIVFLIVVVMLPIIFIGKVLNDFYDFKSIDPESAELVTPSGNYYQHDFNEKMRENGHLVYVYICEQELREQWNKRSEIKYDDDLNGFPLGSTLIRYLTSLGYRKDSTGVTMLTEADINLIERGATNHRFKYHFLSLYPRIYETIWELENYRQTKDPNGKTFAQRIEFIKASLVIIKKKPVFGIGTGNWATEYEEAYIKLNTKLAPENWSPSHNQYINYLVKFGLVGCLWILFALIIPVFLKGHRYNFLFVFFLIFVGIANFGDANLETHTGLSFFVFFYSLLLWNSSETMKKPVLQK